MLLGNGQSKWTLTFKKKAQQHKERVQSLTCFQEN